MTVGCTEVEWSNWGILDELSLSASHYVRESRVPLSARCDMFNW